MFKWWWVILSLALFYFMHLQLSYRNKQQKITIAQTNESMPAFFIDMWTL